VEFTTKISASKLPRATRADVSHPCIFTFFSNLEKVFPGTSCSESSERKVAWLYSHIRPALHCVNTIDVSTKYSRTIRLRKHVLTYLCIACMRLRKPSWVAPTSVKSFPRWETAKAIYGKPVCCVCAYSLHTNYDNKILSTYNILVTRRKYVKSIWQQFHKKQWLAIWLHHCTALLPHISTTF